MHQVFVANQSNAVRVQKLNFAKFLVLSNSTHQKHANYDKTVPLPSAFSQLLCIYQICG